MLKTKRDTTGSVVLAAGEEAAGLDDAAAMQLLTAKDADSIAQLSTWLKVNAKTFAPVVAEAIGEDEGLSAEAARAVLDALIWRAPADGETTLRLVGACLGTIADRITETLRSSAFGTANGVDDALVGSAVAALTANRRSSQSEGAIDCLTARGPGGALVLARAFDAVRSALRFSIVKRLHPSDVLELGDNVVASLARSVTRLAEQLEGTQLAIATRFLEDLGPIEHLEPSEIGVSDSLEAGDSIFHASWGSGTVVTASDETVTIAFGSAGTRTLLRSLSTLRRGV